MKTAAAPFARAILLAALPLAAALPTAADAAPLPLPEAPYAYTVIDQDLTVTLQEFGSNMNLKLNLSPEVRGRVQGPLPELGARGFLDRLLSVYNLEAYFDGSVLHVTSAKEAQSRLLVLGPVPFERFKATLDAFGITDDRYTVRRAPGADVALASGPPRFVALVEQTLAGLVAEEQARPKPVAPAPPPPPAPPPDRMLTVFRGGQAQILRNGRVDYESPPPAPPIQPAPQGTGPAQPTGAGRG